jgi:hypothetical protein
MHGLSVNMAGQQGDGCPSSRPTEAEIDPSQHPAPQERRRRVAEHEHERAPGPRLDPMHRRARHLDIAAIEAGGHHGS